MTPFIAVPFFASPKSGGIGGLLKLSFCVPPTLHRTLSLQVHQVRLERVRQDISRGKEKAKKEITRTLLMWHMESDHTVAQNPALEVRTLP